jgi:hypothetical protein
LGFNVASGRRLWATNEFRSFPPFKLLRGLVLTRDSGPLEWRDRFSGEVIAPWDAQSRSYATNAQIVGDDRLLLEVRGPDDEGDGLRLVKLPDALMRLFKDR